MHQSSSKQVSKLQSIRRASF